MDILIKSFNRAYYLDRCLHSIKKHVKNFNGKIILMDDGTPKLYLDKILLKYPEVQVVNSSFYAEKQKFASIGKQFNNKIPIDLWVKSASEATENFLLLEDDTWFIKDVDFEKLNKEIILNNVVLTKLYWVGNDKINTSKVSFAKENIVIIKPNLYTQNPFLYYFIFYKFNKFKIRKLLRFFKINTDDRKLAYYTIYATAGVIFNKNYFSKLWEKHQNVVDENLQIFNALKTYSVNKTNYAHYKIEVLKTGFISSATNQFKETYKGNVDMFIFNKLLNESWFKGELDTISSLPNDINEKDVINILEKSKTISINNWISWTEDFKNQYKSIGCIID